MVPASSRTFSLNQLESKGGAADALYKNLTSSPGGCPGVVVRMHEKLAGKTRHLDHEPVVPMGRGKMGTERKDEGVFGHADMLDSLPVLSCTLLLYMESNPIHEEAYRH